MLNGDGHMVTVVGHREFFCGRSAMGQADAEPTMEEEKKEPGGELMVFDDGSMTADKAQSSAMRPAEAPRRAQDPGRHRGDGHQRRPSLYDVNKKLPKAPGGNVALPEGAFWLLVTGQVPSDEEAQGHQGPWCLVLGRDLTPHKAEEEKQGAEEHFSK
eukprot:Skav227964  [mRNA]  locus=scaffold146:776075:782637:- [translate_table: standard]